MRTASGGLPAAPEAPFQARLCLLRGFDLALPQDHHPPPQTPEAGVIGRVPISILLEFSQPEVEVGFREAGLFASFVSVPEAPVYEHNRLPLGKYKVRPTRKTSNVKPESQSESMCGTANHHFRCGVLIPHRAHNRRPASD
jgi:hypothetical protein